MKQFLILIFILTVATGCGKETGPDQSYIVNDEQSTVESVSVTDDDSYSKSLTSKLSENEVSDLLKGVSFDEDTCDNNNVLRDILLLGDKVRSLGGSVIDLNEFENDEVGFQKFLSESGVQRTSAMDIANSGTRSTMKSCKMNNMIPPKACWYRSLTISLLKEKIEDVTGIDTKLTSHYRSSCYNEKLGGAKRSDHLGAKAMDIAMGSQENRYQVEKYICEKLWKENYFIQDSNDSLANVSIGLGKTFIHLGIDSTHGRRHWLYNDYAKSNTMPSTCWKVKL